MKKLLLASFIFVCLSFIPSVSAQKEITIHFFYSPTCIHCAVEHEFLDGIGEKYPEVTVYRYNATDIENYDFMKRMLEEGNVERYLGTVPLTFVGREFFDGFDDKEARKIEEAINRQLENGGEAPVREEKINLPIIGEVNIADYSLPALAVILGFLDGFNVCSLGALVLILGMVLILRSRKKIMLFG
ncbi:MAG: hypothetical protein ABIG08_03530, partial [bacterium]